MDQVHEVSIPSVQPSDVLTDFILLSPSSLPVLSRMFKHKPTEQFASIFYTFKKYSHFMLYVFNIGLTKFCMGMVIPSFRHF